MNDPNEDDAILLPNYNFRPRTAKSYLGRTGEGGHDYFCTCVGCSAAQMIREMNEACLSRRAAKLLPLFSGKRKGW